MKITRTKPGISAWLGAGALAGLLVIGVPKTVEAQDTSGVRQDTSQTADQGAEVQNPPGYRGMERPVNVFPPDTADTSSAGDATSRVNQLERQDSLAAQDTTKAEKNPPGYRGMERPVGAEINRDQQAKWQTLLDAARKQPNPTPELRDAIDNLGDQPGDVKAEKATKKKDKTTKKQTTKKQTTEQSSQTNRDTAASTVRVGQDTTGDTTRFEVNAQEGRSAAGTGETSNDTTDIIHRERETPPGVDRQPPPYPSDSEQVWVEQRPSGDSVTIGFDSTANNR